MTSDADDAAARRSDASPASGAEAVTLTVAGDAWAALYREVAAEVVAALGDAMTRADGRLLELHHVGSTAVPGLTTKPTLDLMGRLACWPLDAAALDRLAARGFRDRGEHGIPGRHFLTRGGHDVHLHLWRPEDHGLARHLAFRDLLSEDARVRAGYGALKRQLVETHAGAREAYVDGKDGWVRETTERAERRRVQRLGFGPVRRLARVTADALRSDLPFGAWALGGGWAVDLALERPRRAHDDVDVVVDRAGAAAWMSHLAGAGVRFRLSDAAGTETWEAGRPLPNGFARVQARVGPLVAPSPASAATDDAGPAFWDLALEERPPDAWVLRTDRAVRRPITEAVVVLPLGDELERGIPALAPEIALLCKARLSSRPPGVAKDEADLRDVVPILAPEARAWLRSALTREPAHPWADHLT